MTLNTLKNGRIESALGFDVFLELVGKQPTNSSAPQKALPRGSHPHTDTPANEMDISPIPDAGL
jgi:hypothetical protein